MQAQNREQFSRTSEVFLDACRFVVSNKPISNEVKQMYIHFQGEPLQSYFYNCIIYNIPELTRPAVIEAAAEAYHYQRELNRKIGRTCYEKEIPDEKLLKYVHAEIKKRHPGIEKEIPFDETFRQEVMEGYLTKFAVTLSSNQSAHELLGRLLEYTRKHPKVEDIQAYMERLYAPDQNHGTGSTRTFEAILMECYRRNRPENNPTMSCICNPNSFKDHLNITTKVPYHRNPPTNKDLLYIICIALACSFEEFLEMRAAIQQEKGDDSILTDNHYNSRDAKIQSVIQDIGGWYDQARKKESCVDFLPQTVLRDVDEMLAKHSYERLYQK